MKATESKKLDLNQITDAIEQGHAGLDAARSSAMAGLLAVRRAKAQVNERELNEARKAGDEQAVAFHAERAQANSRLTAMLQREATVAATKVPKPRKNAAIVHGYVWAEKEGRLEAVPKAHVVIGLKEGEELGRQLAEARTDQCGYFSVAVELRETAAKATVRPVIMTNEIPAATAAAAASAGQTQVLDGIVAVLDSSGKRPVARANVRLAPETVSYRELLLSEGDDCKKCR